MSYQIVFSAAAKRDMEKVAPRIVSAIIEFVYGDLALHPLKVGKPLGRELAGSFSARRGPYRILYDIDDSTQSVKVLRVDHRSDVYRAR
ncbi:MAG: type II toxin-antitoxin system RelE/ParE family toxin [Nocardioidaceae bacterium]